LARDYEIEVSWRGFELHPETPPGGIQVSRYFGAGRSEAMHAHMREFAAGFGVEIHLRDHMPNTRAALACSEYARDQGRLDAFRAAVMGAHWAEGRDIEDPAVLAECAESAGLDPEATVAARDTQGYLDRIARVRVEAFGQGVTGIPAFFFGRIPVLGCQRYEVLQRAAERAGARRRAGQ